MIRRVYPGRYAGTLTLSVRGEPQACSVAIHYQSEWTGRERWSLEVSGPHGRIVDITDCPCATLKDARAQVACWVREGL